MSEFDQQPEAHHDKSRAGTVSRRVILHGAAGGAIGVALAGCGGDEPATDAGPASPQPSATDTPTTKPSGGDGGNGGGEALVATSEVPVNGGVIIVDVVVTQPEPGTFKAFSAICTHQGCTVGEVANDVISCPCHGSQFSASDGSVEGGPAPAPLPEIDVEVVDGDVVRA